MTQLQTESQARPSIGDILLTHGFVGEEELAAAIVVQARTGQPLGQILVEAGAITRLELASALAEQWSDQDVSITPLPRPRPQPPGSYGVAMPPVAEHVSLNESIYLGRLHDAIADLGRRVAAAEPLLAQMERRAAESSGSERVDELNLRISGFAERLEATLVRMRQLEATLNTTADQVEVVTGGVEQAFTGLQAGAGELAERLAAIGSVVEAAPTSADLERLRASVAELAERPEVDPMLEGRLESLSSGLDNALGTLDLLSAAVDRLTSRPEIDPALAGRLDALEPRLDGLAALLTGMAPATHLDELRASVGSLAERLNAPPDTAALDELSARIDELGRRADDDGLVLRVGELEARLGADGGALQELRAAAEELAARPAGDPELAARLSALGNRVDELATAVAAPDLEVAGRIEELTGRLAELAGQVEAVAASTEDRAAIEELRGAVDGLAGSRTDDELAARVDELEARLGADGGALQELRAAAEELAARRAGDPELAARLSALGNRVDELAGALTEQEPEGPTREQLEELRLDAELRHADIAARLGGLAERLGAVEAGAGADAGHVDMGPVLDDVREQLDARFREAITQADERARAAEDAAQAWQSERALLESRFEALSARIDGMPHDERAATAAGRGAPAPEGTADDIERMRMAIERLGLSIGEHDRALAELMRSRGVTLRLDELSARIDEVAANGASPNGGGAGGGGGGSPVASSDVRALTSRLEHWESSLEADREKLLARLERMASAIDWRLQRLEADGETTAA